MSPEIIIIEVSLGTYYTRKLHLVMKITFIKSHRNVHDNKMCFRSLPLLYAYPDYCS